MAISDEAHARDWRHVLGLSKLQAGENVVVLTGESSNKTNLENSMRAALAMGAQTCRLDIPPIFPQGPHGADRSANVGITPISGNRNAIELLKRADLVIDLMGLLHSPEQLEVLGAGTRMLMVLEPPEILARNLPEQDDKRRVMAADHALRAARQMRVRSAAGTDLTMSLGQFGTLPEYGFADEPGHWDHWPSGFTSIWPQEGSGEGVLVLDRGDMLFPFKMYVQEPVRMEIRAGLICRIDGGFEAAFLNRYMDAYDDPRAYAISHVGYGLQPKARWTAQALMDKSASLGMEARSYYGNFLFSTGPNAEAGGSNDCRCHIDMPMANCSVYLDGEPMVIDGRVVAPEQKVGE
ncbi:2,5-dihydroxypyridine 5,6-dioxygenase [Lacisediminimonas sp.]|uniref:2,5-dihydroxypyridine 5,6-dioxygenase n=1 Tax=Lacisediminimonas sp. TaxID=3060582 RepID=UPI00271786C1|nr:2,5-dihydroxypyridine 5,6-dioxygenase [Lacisediminimonas sp.]MDO8300408.1 2,5-dihydroxypyridine 5,6-dioxygenase [Lacisediminimonas sp.]